MSSTTSTTEKYLDGISVVAVVPTKGARTERPRIEIVGTRRNEELVTHGLLVERRVAATATAGDRSATVAHAATARAAIAAAGIVPAADPVVRVATVGLVPMVRRATASGPRQWPRPGPSVVAHAPRARAAGPVLRAATVRLLPRRRKPAACGPATPCATPCSPSYQTPGSPSPSSCCVGRGPGRAPGHGEAETAAPTPTTSPRSRSRNSAPDVRRAAAPPPAGRRVAPEAEAVAALAGIDELDLRDLRTVVVAADAAAHETRRAWARPAAPPDGLSAHVDGEHGKWLAELTELVNDSGAPCGRCASAPRPPKAGSPLPAELAERLATGCERGAMSRRGRRWATLVDAVAFSPVRLWSCPRASPPSSPTS